MKFTEAQLEQAFIDLFGQKEFPHVYIVAEVLNKEGFILSNIAQVEVEEKEVVV